MATLATVGTVDLKQGLQSDPKQLMARHAGQLKDYARRLLVHEETLIAEEKIDLDFRMEEFLTVGTSFGLTQKEMVSHILGRLFVTRGRCGCPGCRARAEY